MLLLSLAMVESNHETAVGMNGLLFGALIIVAGFVVYFATGRHGERGPMPARRGAVNSRWKETGSWARPRGPESLASPGNY